MNISAFSARTLAGLFLVFSALFLLGFNKAKAAPVSETAMKGEGLVQDASIKDLKAFTLVDDTTGDIDAKTFDHTLVQVRSFLLDDHRYVRYRQYYQGLEVVGRSVVGHYGRSDQAWDHGNGRFYGKLAKNLKLPVYNQYLTDNFRNSMAAFAREDFKTRMGVTGKVSDLDTQPVIWINDQGEPSLTYKVSFRVQPLADAPQWPHYLISAADSKVQEYWNNIQGLHDDQAPGGNTKTGSYMFGATGMPPFSVTKINTNCYLGNSLVSVISMDGQWSKADTSPHRYPCGQASADPVNGGYAPAHDAYVFANMVLALFQNWYAMPVLTHSNGTAKQMTLLVRVGQNYENAFWNGQYLAFGDGGQSYHPLVSLAVVAHEMSHAFTDEHSDLIYVNQSGAINESFSDMSAVAAEYYLKFYNATAYRSVIGTSAIDWRIGDRIAKGNYALRSLADPSAYASAECYQQVPGCSKTWSQMVQSHQNRPANVRNSNIVHQGSGIMNRAFVNIVNGLNGDVRKAFGLMVRANMLYWTDSASFSEAACGVKQAAQVGGVNQNLIQTSFQQVGVTPAC